MTKMRSTHPPSKPLKRKQGSPHFFLDCHLPTTIPSPFSLSKLIVSTHEGEYPVCLVGLSPMTHRLRSIDRSKSASLFSIMPRCLSILLLSEFYLSPSPLMAGISNPEAIANKSVPNMARKFTPETSLSGFVDV